MLLADTEKPMSSYLMAIDRGLRHARYLRAGEDATAALARELLGPTPARPRASEVRLLEWDSDGEARVAAHALWAASGRSYDEVRAAVANMTPDALARVLATYAGDRTDLFRELVAHHLENRAGPEPEAHGHRQACTHGKNS